MSFEPTIPMTKLTYHAHLGAHQFLPLLHRAADVWNDVLSDLIRLEGCVIALPDGPLIIIRMDSPIDPVRTKENPTRVAECRRASTDLWRITLSSDVKWAISAWDRFWGRGENALTCLIHELGHVFKLPHASDPSYVMHPEIGGNGSLSTREKEHYREHFLRMLEEG